MILENDVRSGLNRQLIPVTNYRPETVPGPSDAQSAAVQPTGKLLYGSSLHPSLRTLKPFSVSFESGDAGVLAIVSELEEYGAGSTRSEALDDLRHTLAELYFSLEKDQHRLSPHLSSLWSLLQSWVRRIPHK